jgi:ATP-binding protein involved in chromosome partitioning
MQRAREIMSRIKHKIAVVGGKGGVGKSITTSNLAMALALKGRKVSILDQDFDGATIPKMFGVLGKKLTLSDEGIIPVQSHMGIEIISMGSILKDDDVLTWFHDMRRNATEEFLSHVKYGDRDYLLIDLPPGTSSDSVNMMQYIPDLDGAVIVTIPSEVSQNVAMKATLLCFRAKVKVFGVIENMSGFICPHCGQQTDVLRRGGGEKLAKNLGIRFFGSIPLDPRLSLSSDEGKPYVLSYPDSSASKAMKAVADAIEEEVGWKD